LKFVASCRAGTRDVGTRRARASERAMRATARAMRVATVRVATTRPSRARAIPKSRTRAHRRTTTRATGDETTYDDAHRVRVTASHDETVFVYEFDAEPTATVDEATARDATEDWTTTTRAVVEETTRAVEETIAETVEETIAETVEETIEAVVEAGRKPVSKMKKAELVALAESLGVDATGTVAALRGRLGPAVRGRAVAK